MLKIGYWQKIVNMKESRLVKQIYNIRRADMMFDEETAKRRNSWCYQIKEILASIGMEKLWDKPKHQEKEFWKSFSKSKLEERANEDFRKGVFSKSKLRKYAAIKSAIGFEDYLDMHKQEKGRAIMTQFRGGTNELQVELGRRRGQPRDERICQVCYNGVEDEKHVITKCSAYEHERRRLIDSMKRNERGGLEKMWRESKRETVANKLTSFVLGGRVELRDGKIHTPSCKTLKASKRFLASCMKIREIILNRVR